jgi:hypothetical protein
MGSVMIRPTMLNAIMMAEIVVDIMLTPTTVLIVYAILMRLVLPVLIP